MKPVSPYAISKAFQDLSVQLYREIYNLKHNYNKNVYLYDPRRTNLFQSSFASQIAKIEKGKQKFLYHGNLKSIRSFLDIDDAVEAYWITAKKVK